MSQTIKLEVKGLHTYSSELSGVPRGGLAIANNVDISRLNIIGPRRGYNYLDYDLPLSADRASKIVFYSDEVFVHYNNATFAYYDPASGFSSRGSLIKPTTAVSINTANINKNLYITSSTGIQKMDDTTASIFQAGLPQGIHIESALSASTGTAIDNGNSVAWRYIVGTKDNNGNFIRGGVSGRNTLSNSSGATKDGDLTIFLPDGLSTSHFIQVYRSIGTTGTPSDDMQLTYEHNLTSTDISNGYVSISDITPDDLLGAYLYTSPSQEGIAENNFEPPVAHDIEEYKNHLFFADVKSKHRFTFTIIGTGSPDGIQVDDTMSITDGTNTETYTAKAAEDGANLYYAVSTGGTAEQNITDTTASLVKIINENSSYWYAYNLSAGSGTLPGKIMLEERTLGGAQFNVTSDRQTAYNPQLAGTATDSQKSSNDEFKNGLMFSKQGQGEAVPLKNIFFVGSSDDRIRRIISLRDGLFIIKEDGVFVLRGNSAATFSVQPLDLTAKIICTDSIVTVNNRIYGLFDAGVCEISDSGVDIISLPIKEEFEELMGDTLTLLDTYGFAISDQVNGKYVLSLPSTSTDTYSTKQFIYDTNGATWVNWDLTLTCGGVNPADNKIYVGNATTNQVKIERKEFDYTDYADFGNTCTISSASTTTLTIDNTDDMAAGDYLEQGSLSSYIVSVDIVAGTVVVEDDLSWTTGVATVTHLKSIRCEVEWNPEFAGNPSGLKMFYETNLIFKRNFQREIDISFFTDTDPSVETITLEDTSGNGAWGEFVWGEEVWGGEQGREPKRVGVPRSKSRCNQISVRMVSNQVYSDFLLNGLSLTFNTTSTRTTR